MQIVNIDTRGFISDTQNMAVTTQRINILFYGIHAGYFHRMHIVSSSLLKPLLSVNIFIGHCQKRLSSRLKVFCLLCTLSPLFESRLSSLLIGMFSIDYTSLRLNHVSVGVFFPFYYFIICGFISEILLNHI